MVEESGTRGANLLVRDLQLLSFKELLVSDGVVRLVVVDSLVFASLDRVVDDIAPLSLDISHDEYADTVIPKRLL